MKLFNRFPNEIAKLPHTSQERKKFYFKSPTPSNVKKTPNALWSKRSISVTLVCIILQHIWGFYYMGLCMDALEKFYQPTFPYLINHLHEST